ncbi:AAA family ATPase [Rhabdothermincola salaria]|uniref:AAA family ATPase n=1 Tax=Rhabdothermincola salaria TaxID=2903142 RepID=UPI001E2D50CD|nr:AAA family ATPase [Rhabdothermincola salaria]MCD9624147.1 AAA family ATPase [Rhabdothermincola salaria]
MVVPRPRGATASDPDGFVGRAHELAALTLSFTEPTARGARLHLIVGDAGIGKTRLAVETTGVARRTGRSVAWATCWDESGTPPYWPWTQIVRQLRGRTGGVELAPLVLEGETARDRFELFDAVAAALHSAASRAPLLLVLDDLHRADPPTLSLLRFVLAHLRTADVAVVATVRTGEEVTDRVADALGALRHVAEVVPLHGLDVEAVAELTGDVHRAADLYALTGGNPLYVEQVLQATADPTGSVPEIGMAALATAVRTRLAALGPEVTEVLAARAVLGPGGTAPDVAALVGVPLDRTEELLGRAVAARVLGERRSLRFTHPLLAEVAADSVPPGRREQLHRLAAARAAEHGASAAICAHHLCAAGPDVWREAVAACTLAAEVATASFAHEDAVTHLQRALEALDDHPDEVRMIAATSFELAGASARAFGRPAAEPAYARAWAAARQVPDPTFRARIAARHGIEYFFTGDVSRERAAQCTEALAALPGTDGTERVRLLANLASSTVTSRVAGARRAAADAVTMARRVGDPVALGIALVAASVVDLGPATLGRRLEAAREIVALAEDTGEHDLAVHGRFLLMGALLERGDVRELDAELAAQDDVLGTIAEPRFARHALWFRCMRAMLDGRHDQVERLALECLAIAEELEDPDGPGVYGGQLGVALWMRGRIAEMEPVYLEMGRLEPEEPLWDAVLAWLWWGDGRADAARGALARVPSPAAMVSGQHTLLTLVTAADAAADLADDAVVAELWDALLPYADHVVPIGMGAAVWGSVARPLGRLALRLGHVDEGVAHLDRAVAVCARLGARPWLAQAQLALAGTLLDLDRGDAGRVEALVAEAEVAVRELQLTVLVPRLEELVARLARRRPPAPGAVVARADAPRPLDPPGRPSLAVLGTFEVTALDGSVATWTSRKARELLKILVARRGAPVPRETMMDLLWPGEDPEVLSNRLSVALSTVRRSLDPERRGPTNTHVVTEAGAIRLDTRTVAVDAERFLALADDAVAAHAARAPDAVDHLRAARDAYRGEALPDEPYAPWAEAFRSETTAAYVRVLRLSATEAVAVGDHLGASEGFRTLLADDPYDESAHRGLVDALRALGAHGQASAAWERYRERMAELGVLVPARPPG